MSQYAGLSDPMDGDPSMPSFSYKPLLRILYLSLLTQASLSYIFFSLGALFSENSLRNHLLGLYAFVFGSVTMAYHFSYKPVKDRVHLFFPKLEEDIVKHTVYFLVGLPGVGKSDSFQYRLASILLTLVGFVGTLVSLRHPNLMSSFSNRTPDPYEQA